MTDPQPRPQRALAARVVRSGLWLLGLALTTRVLGILRLSFLARWLGPREFGVVDAAVVAITILEAVSDLGLYLALIQRQDPPRSATDTAWTLGVIRGAFTGAVVFLGAPAIAALFRAPEAEPIVRVMAVVPLVGSLVNVGTFEFRRDLEYGRYYLLQAGAVLADLAVAVPLAIWLHSEWALVAGWLALSSVRVMLSYVLHPYRPRLLLDFDQAVLLLSYGRWITGSSALRLLASHGATAVVGAGFGVEGLGLYQMAWRLTGGPAAEAATLVGASTVAAYAKLAHSLQSTRAAFLRVLRLATLISTPLVAAAALYADGLVLLLLGSAWQEVVPLVRTLLLFVAASAWTALVFPVFQGLGEPRRQMLVAIAEVGVLAVTIWPLVSWLGLLGAAVSVLAHGLLAGVVSIVAVSRRLDMGRGATLAALVWPAIACIPMVVLKREMFADAATPSALLLALLASAAVYAAALIVLVRLRLYDVDDALKRPRALFDERA